MRPPKTLDEIKSALLARAGRGNPVRHMTRREVEVVVGRLRSVDPDHWAKVWSEPAESWLAKAVEAESTGRGEAAREHYLKAYAYFAAARYPALFSSQMEQAYLRARDAYLKASRYFDPPLEVVRIPFEKKEIVGYLRLRPEQGKQPPPQPRQVLGLGQHNPLAPSSPDKRADGERGRHARSCSRRPRGT